MEKSLAQKMAASKKASREQEEAKARAEVFNSHHIAKTIVNAKRKKPGQPAFPSDEIETLVELAYKQVALHFN